MEIKEGIDQLLAEDMIPRDHYKLKIARVREKLPPEQGPNELDDDYNARVLAHVSPWCIVSLEILAAKDPQNAELVGRRCDWWLVSEYEGRVPLRSLLIHKNTYYPDEGWAAGIPEIDGRKDTKNLIGTTFDATVVPKQKKNGEWAVNVYPICLPGQKMLEAETPF